MPVVEPELYIEREEKQLSRFGFFWNFLSFLLMVGILLFAGIFFLIFRDPASAVNPFPPPTMPARVIIPSATFAATDAFVAPITTDLATTENLVTDTVVETPQPTAGLPIVTMAPSVAVVDPTQEIPSPTSGVNSAYPFALQSQPAAIQAAVLYPDRDCKWMGVGGQVLDMQGRPYTGITIQMGGFIDGNSVYLTSLTGTALQYGPAGYEFTIADAPIASKSMLWLRLVDQAGLALSERIYFDTFDQCGQNLVVINFKQVK